MYTSDNQNVLSMNFPTGKDYRPIYRKLTNELACYAQAYANKLGIVVYEPNIQGGPIKDLATVKNWVSKETAILLPSNEEVLGCHTSDSANTHFMEYEIAAATDTTVGTADGEINIGAIEDYYAFMNDVTLSSGVVITGTNKANAVKAFGDMLKGGAKFKVDKIHVVGTDAQSFSLSPQIINHQPNGDDKKTALPWPKTGPDANQSNVRILEGAALRNLVFHGNNVLNVPIPGTKSLSITIYGTWIMP